MHGRIEWARTCDSLDCPPTQLVPFFQVAATQYGIHRPTAAFGLIARPPLQYRFPAPRSICTPRTRFEESA